MDEEKRLITYFSHSELHTIGTTDHGETRIKSKFTDIAYPNEAYKNHDVAGHGKKIIGNGIYQARNKNFRRYTCHNCKKAFCVVTKQIEVMKIAMNSDSTFTNFILPFDSPDATLAKVGGKGANISLMTKASFPVPSDFLITTKAYRTFVQANNLQKQIVDLASNQADTSEKRSVAIRQLFANGKIPAEIVEAINQAYVDLVQTAGGLSWQKN